METEVPPPETLEGEADTLISIEYERRWPRYVAAWSARVQRGETDYPLAADTVEAMPDRETEPSEVWTRLRERALAAAEAAISSRVAPAATSERKRGFLSRLLGRD